MDKYITLVAIAYSGATGTGNKGGITVGSAVSNTPNGTLTAGD
jgi:hypothetical protein